MTTACENEPGCFDRPGLGWVNSIGGLLHRGPNRHWQGVQLRTPAEAIPRSRPPGTSVVTATFIDPSLADFRMRSVAATGASLFVVEPGVAPYAAKDQGLLLRLRFDGS